MKLPKKLSHPKKRLINIQNIDENECLNAVRYLHPADHSPRRITKAVKDLAKERVFKEIQFPGKI